MTATLFVNARLIDPEAAESVTGHLLVRDGLIAGLDRSATPTAPEDAQIVDCAGHCLAPGIVDIGVKVSEPGERHKESFRSAGRAAVAGGVTTIVTRPDTDPPIDTPEVLEFVARRAALDAPVRVLPMAALTKGRMGCEMTEIGFCAMPGPWPLPTGSVSSLIPACSRVR